MVKKRKKKVKSGAKLFILLFIIVCGVLVYFAFFNKEKVLSGEVKKSKVVKKKVVSETKVSRASLVMVGDALLHSSVYKDAYVDGRYDFNSQIEFIKPISEKYDLAFYNQETVLGGTELGLSDYPTFNSPQEFGDNMIDSGFNLVNLASNHTIDRGEKAIIKSCEYWNSKKDKVLSAGSYCSSLERDEIKIKEVNGIKYTMLSYTYGTNGIPVPSGKEYLVNLYSDEQAKKDIEEVRDKVDLLLVSMHWGVEYQSMPNEEQKREAEYLASLGVDVIIGTHPHVIQPVTYINNTLVIYSLGNFISAQDTDGDYNCMVELMSSIDIVKETKGSESKVHLENLNNELLYNYYKKGGGRWYGFKVIPFSQMNSSYNYDYKRLYEKYSGIVRAYNSDIPINPIS